MLKSWQLNGAMVLCGWLCACDEQGAVANDTDEPAEASYPELGDEDASDPSFSSQEPTDATAPHTDCPRLIAGGAEPLIDDFEGGGGFIASLEDRAGQWFYYNDGSGGHQTVDVIEDESRVLHVKSSDWTIWGSGFGTTLSPASMPARLCPYDVSAYEGLSFRAKGRGRVRLRLPMPDNTPAAEGGECTKPGQECYDWPGAWIHLENDWRTQRLPFCVLQPEGWAGPAPELDLTQLGGIHFQLEGNAELWLDDLQFTHNDGLSDAGSCLAKCPLEAAPPNANLTPDESWLPLTQSLTLHTFEQETTSCGEITRRYLSYVPGALELPTSAPVLMALHGSSANAESFQELMARGRLDQLAERDGFVVVYGNAAPGAHTDPDVPNSGSWRQDYYDDGQVDDVDYLLRVIEDLHQRGVTSGDNEVYLTGLSNGGGMVLEAAKRVPDRLAGIAPFMPFDGFEPTPVPNVEDTGLKKVLFGYAPNDPGLPIGYDDILSPLPAQWGEAMGIAEAVINSSGESKMTDIVVEGQQYDGDNTTALATRDSRIVQRDFSDPEHGAHLRVLIFENAGHFWPNPIQDTEAWIIDRWGFRNQDLDASDAVWEFFRGD